MDPELRKALDDLKSIIEERDALNEQLKGEVTKLGDATTETIENLKKLETATNDYAERLSALEVKSQRSRIHMSDVEKDASEAERTHLNAFIAHMRSGLKGHETAAALTAAEEAVRAEKNEKAVTGISDTGGTAGGHGVPEILAQQIMAKILDISDVRGPGGVLVTPVGSPDYKRIVDELGTISGWVGESDTRSETGTPALNQVSFTHGELYALPKASEWSLDDIFFNVEGWLTESVSREFAFQEGDVVINGDGTNKPTGFLTGTPVAIGDEDSPARAFGTLEYVPSGAAGAFPSAALSPALVSPGDSLIDLTQRVKAMYRSNGWFWMNKATLGEVRKMKDFNANYIWTPGLIPGQPSQLLGYPINEAESMPAIAANSFPIAFGDFRQAYEMIEIAGMRMTRDDNLTAKGFVLFFTRRRLGGKLVNDDALKVLKMSAT